MTTVIVEIDEDGVNAVYADDPSIRVVIVDHSWENATGVTCPFPSPAPLERYDSTMRKAAEQVIANPDQPQMIERT